MQQMHICIYLQLVAIMFTLLNTEATRHVLNFDVVNTMHIYTVAQKLMVENLAGFLPKYIHLGRNYSKSATYGKTVGG